MFNAGGIYKRRGAGQEDTGQLRSTTGGMHNWRDAQLEGCRTGGMQDWRETGPKGGRTARMQNWKDAGEEGFTKGAM